MPKANHKTIRTNKHELFQAAHWLLFDYVPCTNGTIAGGPIDPKQISKDSENAKNLGDQFLKASSRKRDNKMFPIAIDKELVNWFAKLASVNLFHMKYQLREKNRRYGMGVPEFAYNCLPYSRLRRGRRRLSREEVDRKVDQDIHDARWIRILKARQRESNMVGTIATGYREKTP